MCRSMKCDSCKKLSVWAGFCARWSSFRNTFFCTFSLHFNNDNLTQDETPGDSWNDAMSRKGAWEE